jgi:hypothetical protein
MSRDDAPKIMHDTRIVIDVNEAGCALFRCEPLALVDLDMLELLVRESDKYLAAQRMMQMRLHGRITPFTYLFRRCDKTKFWAAVTSERAGQHFETTVIYIREEP